MKKFLLAIALTAENVGKTAAHDPVVELKGK